MITFWSNGKVQIPNRRDHALLGRDDSSISKLLKARLLNARFKNPMSIRVDHLHVYDTIRAVETYRYVTTFLCTGCSRDGIQCLLSNVKLNRFVIDAVSLLNLCSIRETNNSRLHMCYTVYSEFSRQCASQRIPKHLRARAC